MPDIYGFNGILLVFTTQLFPLVFLYVQGAMSKMDASLLEAAENMGCTGVKRFFTVVLPLIAPTVLAGALLVFVRAVSDFGTPMLIGEGYRTFTVILYNEFVGEVSQNKGFASAISILAILITMVVYFSLLVVYSPATDAQVNAVVPLFEERYGIKVEVITGGTGELLARIDAEGDAPYCDVVFGGGESSYAEYRHVFQDYVSSEDANLIESCRNTLGYCTNYCLDCAILMYNNDLIGDLEINGYMDLLQPELKGRISSADPTASSSAMMHIETILTDFGGLTLENEEVI